MSSRQENIKKLIATHERRLQKLKEQQAAFGLHTPPHISTEIEDVETTIQNLRQELKGRAGEEDAGPAAKPGSNYHINIGTAQGVVIGEGAVVTQSFGSREAASPPLSPPGGREAAARCADLAENIRETLELIKQYEQQRRLAGDPKLKRRAEGEIADLQEQLAGYQAEARRLGCQE